MQRQWHAFSVIEQGLEFRSFIGDGEFDALGNDCLLLFNISSKQASVSQTLCELSLSEQNILQLQCAIGAYSIRCCGHGLLAAAKYLLTEVQNSHTNRISIYMNGSQVDAYLENAENLERVVGVEHTESVAGLESARVWLVFAPLELRAVSMPIELAEQYAAYPYNAVSEAEGSQGYCLIEWQEDVDISALAIPLLDASSQCQQAIIFTKRICENIIAMRYFAPQYGVSEDVATGSSARVVTAYYRKPEIRIQQYSSSGGLLFGRFKPTAIEVGGYCEKALEQESKDDQ